MQQTLIMGLVYSVMLGWLAACAPAAEPPPTAVAVNPTPDATPTTLLSLTATAIPTESPTAVPSPTPAPTLTPTPTPPPLPAGLAFYRDGRLTVVGETGGLVDLGRSGQLSPDGQLHFALERVPDPAAPNGVNLTAVLTHTQTLERVVLVDQLLDARLHDWWEAEPEWVVLRVGIDPAFYDDVWFGSVQTMLVKIDGSERRLLHSGEADGRSLSVFPAANPQGGVVAFDSGGVGWLHFLENNRLTRIDLEQFGLDVGPDYGLVRPSWSPDGLFLTWGISDAGYTAAQGEPRGFVMMNLSTFEVTYYPQYDILRGLEGWIDPPRWTADGRLLFYGYNPGEMRGGVWLMRTDGTVEQVWEELHTPGVPTADGRFRAKTWNNETVSVDIFSGEVTLIEQPSLRTSPNGRYSVYTRGNAHFIIDNETGEEQPLPLQRNDRGLHWLPVPYSQ